MSVPLTELILETVIRYGLQDLKNQPSKIDMLFEKLLISSLKAQYGQKEIDSVKNYILNNKISVVQAWPLVAEKIPCYSLLITGTEEMPDRAFFSDDAGQTEIPSDPNTLLAFTPLSYDNATGFIYCSPETDLSNIYVGAIFVDAANQQFELLGAIIDEPDSKKFAIASDCDVVIGESFIIDRPSWDIAPVHETPMMEHIQIGIHAGENTNLCKYLYYMLLYFLQSRRMELENIGIQLHSFTVTDFVKNLEFLPDNILNRFVNFRAIVWFNWKEDIYKSLTRSEMQLKVDKDVWIKRGDYTVITTDGTEPKE